MAFREVTNIKAKAGSQGTLFQGGYPTGHHRGYTPERLAAVREHADVPGGWAPKGGGTKPERARMIDTIARSTVPVEDIKGVQFSPGQAHSSDGPENDDLGSYHRDGFGAHHLTPEVRAQRKAAGNLKPSIAVRVGHSGTTTPIHEIGHHVSHTQGTDHSAYDNESRRGAEEGFADNYAVKHFRDRRGKPLASKENYGGVNRRSSEFQSAYHGQRNFKNPQEASLDPAKGYRDRTYPESHVPGQIPLIHKNMSGYTPGSTADKAHGPPSIELNKEALA